MANKRLTKDQCFVIPEVNGLAKRMNAIYQGVRSNSSVFLQGKPNITLVFKIKAKNLLVNGTSSTDVVMVNDNGK